MAKKNDRYTKNALIMPDDEATLTEALKYWSKVRQVIIRGGAGNQNVIQVNEHRGQSLQDANHEVLKSLACVAQAERHP